MFGCPIEGCGRQFQNQLTMLQHVKRRHPQQSQKIRQQTTNQMLQKQNRITEQMNKLPKMQKVLQMSKQKKTLQFQRRSSSKNKKINSIIQNNTSKISDIITQSRQLVDENSNSRKLLKRPSLSKKTSEQNDKLPSLNQSNVKKLKLSALKSQFNSTVVSKQSIKQSNIQKLNTKNELLLQKQSQTAMYSTAPNFSHQMNKKIQLIRSRGKKQGQISNRSSSKDIKQVNVSESNNTLHKKRLSSQTMQSLIQSEKSLQQSRKPIQRPVKRLLQKGSKKQSCQSNSIVTNEQLSQSTFIERPQFVNENKKQFSFQPKKRPLSKDDQRFTKKIKSPQGSPIIQTQIKQPNSDLIKQLNWQQRTVTIRNKQLNKITIPQNSQVEYLYITNCNLSVIDLNQCFSLISLTLANNNLKQFTFLQSNINGAYQNLQSLYLDHNCLTSLNSLPTYLQLRNLSLTFNKIQGLDDLLKVLVKLPYLEQLDLSFNPVRKQTNYKLAVLAACKGLKKLDGMVVTKFDRQLASQYHKMYFDYLNIIPLSSSPISQDKFRPSTAVSMNYQQQLQNENQLSSMTEQQLNRQIQILEKMIKNTKDQYEIIQQQNRALQDEINSYEVDFKSEQNKQDEFNPKVYKKLCKQVQELELLNFLQYASEKQLQQILYKKVNEKGLRMQMLTVN